MILIPGCSLNKVSQSDDLVKTIINGSFTWETIVMPTDNIHPYSVYTTQGDIQILPWKWRSEWVRNANIDEPKFIWLEKSLSYETSFGVQKYISMIYKTKLDNDNWEIQRFIREQNLTKIDTNIQNMFASKIQKNKKELTLLWVDTKLLDNMIENQSDLLLYSTEKTYKNKQYFISLYHTEHWVMIDVYDKRLNFNVWNNTFNQTWSNILWDKTYKKVSLVPFAPPTNGPDLACEYMKLIDESGIEIQIPAEIKKYIVCEDIQVVSPNFRFVLYNYFKPLSKESLFVIYDIEANKTYTIWIEFVWVDALQCQRSLDNRYIVCAVVWQEWLAKLGDINKKDLPYISKFTIFELWENFWLNWNTSLLSKKEIFQKNSETIQFVCGDSCRISDFIIWTDSIQYTWHEILSDSKWFSVKYR